MKKKIPLNGLNRAKDITYTERELDNGLKIILSEDKSIPSVAINLCYHAGSKDEDTDNRGYAHLFEHLMFEGSKNLGPGEYDRLSLLAGCENNAYTTEDKTNYFLLAPSNQLEFGLWLESDRMLEFSVTEESLELQKGVVIEEKKQVYDNRPYGSVGLEFPPKLFFNNGYSWDTIGDVKDISCATLPKIRKFFDKYYVPDNAVLSIAGDIDYDRTYKLIEKYFSEIPRGKYPINRKFDDKPVEAESVAEVFDEIQLPGIFMAYKIPEENTRESYEFDVLSDILSSGESSRFYRRLIYEKKLVSEAGAWVDGREFSGIFYIYAILMPGVKPADVQNEIDNIINEVIDGNITDNELNKIINRIETRYTYKHQTILNKADSLAHYKTFYNNASMINNSLKNYTGITKDDIQLSSAKYLQSSKRVILNYLPKTKKKK